MTSLLCLYKAITRVFNSLLPLFLQIRIILGLEEKYKSKEKLMRYTRDFASEKGRAKEVLMIHSASLGEFNAVTPLIKALESPDRLILLTTTTEAATIGFKNYQITRGPVLQVYLPFDTPQLVEKFLNFWQVNTLLLVESEIWPNLIMAQAKRGKIAIISGRLSDKSTYLWKFAKKSLTALLTPFAFIGAGSQKDLENFQNFYPQTILTGNLKCDGEPLPVDKNDLEEMRITSENREILLAISTHPGEEEIILEGYKKTGGLLILAPRQKDRAIFIMQLFQKAGFKVALRYQEEVKNNNLAGIDVLIVNSFGELGTFFSLSKKVFLGGSLVPKIGGHNPCEPALFACKIIVGPYYHNFQNLMNDMKREGALVEVANAEDLAQAWKGQIDNFGEKALEFILARRGALTQTLALIIT